MIKFFLILLLAFTAMACAKNGNVGATGPRGIPGPAAPTPTPAPAVDEFQEDVDFLVKDENDYRLGLGQTQLSSGLSCSVQAIASGQRISSSSNPALGAVIVMSGSSYSYLYKGAFNQPDTAGGASALLPLNIRNMFVGLNYLIRCQGQLVVQDTDYYNFDVTSDDGALLYVDGATVINNDGNHGMTQAFGTKFLRRGVHTFRVDYAQTGGGNFGLILKSNAASIDSRLYFH